MKKIIVVIPDENEIKKQVEVVDEKNKKRNRDWLNEL